MNDFKMDNVKPFFPDAGEQAREEWARMICELSASGIRAIVNRAALAAYCVAWSRWRKAELAIADTGGEVVKSPSGFPIQNPWLSIANRAISQMHAAMKKINRSA